MSAQHVVGAPGESAGPRFGHLTLAGILGGIAVLLLLLAISAPWWLEADLEAVGIDELMAQASTLQAVGTTLWLFAVPLAVVLGATAVGVATRASAGRIGIFIVAAVAALVIPILVGALLGEVVPLYFGVGGTLIEVFLVLTFWFWARERSMASDTKKVALDLRMSGYGLFAAAAWFVCGMLAMPIFGLEPQMQLDIGSRGLGISMAYGLMAYLVMGWALIFASQYMTTRQAESD